MFHKTKLLFIFTSILFIISGCSQQPGQNNTGFFHQYFVEPFSYLIHFFAELSNGSYGVAIILITLLIRILLFPFMLRQYKSQQAMKEKMELIKPEMEIIQKRMKEEKDPAKQKEIQQEMIQLYQKHNFNPLNIGCLPLLIQMPILMGLYYAIRGSNEIATHSFLWFNLGQPDIVMTVLAGAIYYIQFVVSQRTLSEEQRKQMRFMGLMSPIMIMIFSFSSPAALPLYWSVGGLFLIGQTLLSQKLYKK
ncbi:membrane protein insertase YidC [Metabacillus fastidiosus]|uniref:membrane protein insertase YidC n=1 Tax=Metabacillus fastidiosus TaxID=1458 RepID=UPI003D282437